MWTLTGFADEISPELDEQLDTLTQESITYMELRSVWNKNVLDLTDEELEKVASAATQRGIGISSIGSPIGKVPVTDSFGPHLRRFRRALRAAEVMDAPYIRVFSFFIPEGHEPGDYREEVVERMGVLAGEAQRAGVTLLHENEKDIYGDIPRRCLDIVTSVDSAKLRLAWDAANFVQVGVRPFTEGYAQLRPYVDYIQIKDARLADASVVVAGAGDGEVVETIRALRADGFDGFFSLEPHLADYNARGGFSGAELWTSAWRAFTDILNREGIQFA